MATDHKRFEIEIPWNLSFHNYDMFEKVSLKLTRAKFDLGLTEFLKKEGKEQLSERKIRRIRSQLTPKVMDELFTRACRRLQNLEVHQKRRTEHNSADWKLAKKFLRFASKRALPELKCDLHSHLPANSAIANNALSFLTGAADQIRRSLAGVLKRMEQEAALVAAELQEFDPQSIYQFDWYLRKNMRLSLLERCSIIVGCLKAAGFTSPREDLAKLIHNLPMRLSRKRAAIRKENEPNWKEDL